MKIDAEFPSKLRFLFQPMRYKIARGGRGSAKSWSFARALLIMGISRKLRICCGREVQKSIRDSVHQLLKDQVELLGLQGNYDVQETKITGVNGTLFTFVGLASLTIETIKSLEGYDILWVEEGQTTTKRSWTVVIPTIRKKGSEIWVTYNPELETDETHQRFTINPPPDCINVEINWRDNPWFPEVLEKERQHCKTYDPDNYDNIWEGKCKPAVEGAIYYKQIQEAEDQGRIRAVPYDPMLRVHIVFDLGWEDSLAAGLVQKLSSEIRIIEYLEASQTKLDSFSSELKTRNYNWGRMYLPHDGFARRLESNGKSTADIMKALGWDVVPRDEIVEMSVEEGIRATRLKMHQMYFDSGKCAALNPPDDTGNGFYHTPLSNRLIEILKRYKRRINKQTDAAGAPLHDKHAHGADMLRYVAINAEHFKNDTMRPTLKITIPAYSGLSI
jgi:phage terminase large subunit